MGVQDDAEGISRQVWGAKGQQDGAAPHPNSEAEAHRASSEDEHFHIGADRADCTGGIPRGGLAGGILKQLIHQAENQLREARACISWYQEAEEKAEQQLANLLELQRLAENDHQDS